jgi:hypothetical protein
MTLRAHAIDHLCLRKCVKSRGIADQSSRIDVTVRKRLDLRKTTLEAKKGQCPIRELDLA